MFHYTRGDNLPFKDIANKHYEGLKCINNTNTVVAYYSQSVIQRASEEAKGNGSTANFFKDLIKENCKLLKKIITGDTCELKAVIKEFIDNQKLKRYPTLRPKKSKNGKVYNNCFFKKIEYVFDYNTFSKKTSKWNAYNLAEELGINVCAYCNRNYTFTLSKPEMIVRPELDHFLPKSKYPYLALSFYNLIPSCHICNSNLKHKIDFNYDQYIHPYELSFDAGVRFSMKLRSKNNIPIKDAKNSFGIQFFYGDKDSFDLVLKSRKLNLGLAYYRKVLNHNKVFKITDLYNNHKDMVMEMIQVARIYNDDYINQLYRTYQGQLFNSREDVVRMVTRNFPNINEMPNRPFSKLTKDLFEELGLTY
ncbi:HNH endonuclease [Sphingobacterium multivorum]|uniref:HNH endonuclease n=1 Tax=Sphingobacterium multivorum TaxID=28454 RepID=UPI0028ABD9D5|nr:hypothetical protein [Sphingobacterium multivorum]